MRRAIRMAVATVVLALVLLLVGAFAPAHAGAFLSGTNVGKPPAPIGISASKWYRGP